METLLSLWLYIISSSDWKKKATPPLLNYKYFVYITSFCSSNNFISCLLINISLKHLLVEWLIEWHFIGRKLTIIICTMNKFICSSRQWPIRGSITNSIFQYIRSRFVVTFIIRLLYNVSHNFIFNLCIEHFIM